MGGQRRRLVAATIAAILAVLIASGCQDTATTPPASPSPSPDRIPADFDVTFRWIPGAVFDVSGQEGTFVRAFVESFELANAGRSVDWGYHGFAHAAPSNIAQMIAAYPPEQSAANPGVGTAFFTGLRRVDDGDWTRIILCRHGYRSIKVSDREWSSRVDRPRPIEIDFRRSHTALPTNTRGTARTPRGDVFGDWYATRYDFSAIYPRTTADEHACAAAAPSEVPARAPEIGPRPWPSLPPSPGWQATSPL
ncbi:hypothetical protein [Gordonia insulae]|uniref:Uncharacterized protein n=1 Tax=Gordonia insulae TaxID=2420509 RepID=A0A3G8JNH5_9ACTN|nr:hypothetical protein [Gordonia insulae]AZG46644.1 hypothetical protein D7316_03245 [Gordonia insulae]